MDMPLVRREYRPLEPRLSADAKPGIVTLRRQPPKSGVQPRRPPPRFVQERVPDAPPFTFNEAVAAGHHRWNVHTGVAIKEAAARAVNAAPYAGDALDALVETQIERQKRLRTRSYAPPVVGRLYDGAAVPKAAYRAHQDVATGMYSKTGLRFA
jgi:hypothetical protein